jgi:hypothetical protein
MGRGPLLQVLSCTIPNTVPNIIHFPCPGEFLLAVKAKIGNKLASKWLDKQLKDGTTLLQSLSEACGGDPDLLDDVTADMLPSPPLPPALVVNLVKAFQPPQGAVLTLYNLSQPTAT